jgi:hypothetical protein
MSKKLKPPLDGGANPLDISGNGAAQPVQSCPVGRTVFVCASKFSKSFSLKAAEDFQAGKVKGSGEILLPDGKTIKAGPTYETTMSAELLQMIMSGVLQASVFGKLCKTQSARQREK